MALKQISTYNNAFFIENEYVTLEKVNETKHINDLLLSLSKNKDFKKYNFIFCCSQKNNIYESTYIPLPNKVLFIWGDTQGRIPLKEVIDNHSFVFKAHMSPNNLCYKNFFAYPLGIPKNVELLNIENINSRPIDIFFAGNLNSNRKFFLTQLLGNNWFLKFISLLLLIPKIGNILKPFLIDKFFWNLDKIRKNSIIRFTKAFQAGFQATEYSKILSKSKIVLSPKGFHDSECFRFYEATRQGCVVITEKLPTHEFYNYTDAYIEIDTWHNINDIIDDLLRNPQKLEKISKNAITYYNEKLSPSGVANYIWAKIHKSEIFTI